MRTLLILVTVLAFFLSASTTAQHIVPIPDGGWRLWLDRNAQWENDSLYLPEEVHLSQLPVNPPTGGWKVLETNIGIPITLPSTVEEHFWGVQGFRPYAQEYAYEAQDSAVKNGSYLGVSWWWGDIEVPTSFKGKLAILFVRGARLRAEVYLNEHLVGYNIITETSFKCDVTTAIRPGQKNRIAIRITNPGGRLDWVDTELMSWGKTAQKFHKSHGFGGLDRGLELRAHDPIYINNIWTSNTPQTTTISAHAAITNTTDALIQGRLRIEILDPDQNNRVCTFAEIDIDLSPAATTVHHDIEYGDAQLWSDMSPKLYRLRATLTSSLAGDSKGGKAMWKDSANITFGFRWFEAVGVSNNAMLMLNGKRIRLTSAISWGFWGRNGLWPTPELAEREVRAAKGLGMNCIQFHRNVGKTEVLDAQDRLGLLRYMEPGGGQTSFGEKFNFYAPSPKERIDDSGKEGKPQTFAEKYMEEKIVRMVQDHRHHPSLLLYCIQNEIHPDLRNPRIFRVLRRIHQEDPSRIVVLKSGFPSGSPSVNQAWMQPYSEVVHYDTGNGYSGWWDDHTVGGPGVWRDDMYKSPEDFTHRSTNDKEIVMWGEMLGAAAPDNHAAIVRELKVKIGTSYDLKEHEGILAAYDRFLDRWEFRKAFPTANALFVSIGNKSYDFWGRVVETARLAEANDYFVMSGWESTAIENHSGLVDNLRGFKGDPSLISKRLSPLRPVIRTKSLVFAKNDKVTIDLYLLNETQTRHPRMIGVWLETPQGARITIGMFAIPEHQKDRFVYPIVSSISTPPLDAEGLYTLHAELMGSQKVSGEEQLLVIDPVGRGTMPKKVGILSIQPNLTKSFQLLPGVMAEPYLAGKEYDLLVAANRFTRPFETQTDSTTEIQATDDDELYRSINYGDATSLEFIFSGLPKDTGKVTLKFAELFQNAEGMRVFDVALNGDTVLRDFDVFKAAGGKNIAYDRTFSVPLPEGILHITFPKVPRPSARICAIKIEAGTTTVAVNCGGKVYKDKNGLEWKPYEPPVQFDTNILSRVKEGLPLLVLSEGDAATEKYGEELGKAGAFEYKGYVGEARASWMGSWYFVRKHPVYEGLPVDCAMTSFYQVPVTNASGVLLEGKNVEVFAGYSRDHDRNIAAASFVATLGKARILFHSIPGVISGSNGESTGMHPLMLKRLIANSLLYLTKK